MKKNFFKKLSFVMASAMVLSVISPAAGAFAATAPTLNSKATKYLYLAVEDKDEYDFNINNKKTGWKYKWTSSKTSVATVNSKGVTTAEGAGTTTIKVAITDAKGKKVKTLSNKVTVRDNIETLEITNLPKDNILAIGETNDFNRSYVTVAGLKKGTEAKVAWEVSDKENATIDANGVFSATKAGEYTITVRAFQSSAKRTEWRTDAEKFADYVTATATTKVTVKGNMEKPVQVDLDTVKVPFASEVADVDKNLSLYALIGSTKVKVTTIKAITLDDAKKVATVDLYVPFTEGATYSVEYTDMDPVQFVAATTKEEDVASVVVKTTKAITTQSTKIEVELLNKDGVNIANTALLNRVDFTTDSTSAVMNGDNILLFTKGETAKITATFHSYKWNTTTGVEEGNVVGYGVITAVDADDTIVGSINAWTILDQNLTNVSYSANDLKKALAVKDQKRVYVELKTSTGTNTGSIKSSDAVETNNFTFSSSDENTLYVDKIGNLYPIKAGTVTVIVKYKDTVVDAIAITISPERKAAILELSAYTLVLSNSLSVKDSAEVTVKVKDTLGDEITVTDLAIEKIVNSSKATNIGSKLGTDKVKFEGVVGNLIADPGSYTYKISANGLTRTIGITVVAPTNLIKPDYYALEVPTTQDLKVDANGTTKSIDIKLFGMAGTKLTKETVSGAGFKVEITTPKNVTVQVNDTYSLVTAVSGGAITKADTGKYLVTAYKLEGTTWVAVDREQITVTDTQAKPVLSKVKARNVSASTLDQAVNAAFEFTLNGSVVSANNVTVTAADIIGDMNGQQVYIVNVRVREYIGNSYIEHIVAVNNHVVRN